MLATTLLTLSTFATSNTLAVAAPLAPVPPASATSSQSDAHLACTPVVKWIWDGAVVAPTAPFVCSTPVVVQLTDDDGDGRIDERDTPDVAFVRFGGGASPRVITALDGATGREHWSTDIAVGVGFTALAAGDIDDDGIVELVSLDESDRLVAFEHTGALKWIGDTNPIRSAGLDALSLADLDQDGAPEISVASAVWNSSGSLRWFGSRPTDRCGPLTSLTSVADIDSAMPGLELLQGNSLYSADGIELWHNPALPDGATALADFDGDGDPEIVLATAEDVYLLDHAGTALGPPHSVPGRCLQQPVVADFDGDGVPEVYVQQRAEAQVLEWTGAGFTLLWAQPIDDPSGSAGAVAYDFDGDGAAEIIYRDEIEWAILDGRTGAVLSRTAFPSGTGLENPIVADIDGNCDPEIIVSGCGRVFPAPTDGPSDFVIAYDCPGSRPARRVWNQLGYHIDNVEDDAGIPRVEMPSWLSHNTWRAQQPAACPRPASSGR